MSVRASIAFILFKAAEAFRLICRERYVNRILTRNGG
jgi:hypothetical protein